MKGCMRKLWVCQILYGLVLTGMVFAGNAKAATLEVGKSGYPYTKIQDAINAAGAGDTVLVHDGIYVENINFNGKAITVRSENGAESTIIDGNQISSVVKFNSKEGGSTVLDGFTIKNGADTRGGGIYCYQTSPLITNCIIRENTATYHGGGIYCEQSSATIKYCTISNNSATASGGGIYSHWHGTLTIANCIISNNTASSGGGIAYYDTSTWQILTNCIIEGNTASSSGGGIACRDHSSPTITNCLIIGNTASSGGGIYCHWFSSPIVTNCTISNNIAYSGISCGDDSTPTVVNSILWENNIEIYLISGGTYHNSSVTITHSNVKGGDPDNPGQPYPGNANIDADPLFVYLTNGDYHLQSGSPCIDTGTSSGAPNEDAEGTSRPQGLGYDMGAYEYCNSPEEWYKDADGDGYSDGTALTQCPRPKNFYLASELTATSGDCDDGDANINPETNEVCKDGKDNDCDGNVDEGCSTATGDVNGDGNITPQDALMAFQYYLGIIPLDECQQSQAEVTGDGNITPADALCIFRKYLGLPSCLGFCGETHWYKDVDKDGYSDGSVIMQCDRPENYYLISELRAISSDCDENKRIINPETLWYKDSDGDGSPDGTFKMQCESPGGDYYLSCNLTEAGNDCVNIDWEETLELLSDIDWKIQDHPENRGITSSNVDLDNSQLVLDANLIGSHESNAKGEVLINLRYIPGLEGKTPIDMSHRKISAEIIVPHSFVGDNSHPNGIAIFVKDINWRNQYGAWLNIERGGKHEVFLSPTTNEIIWGDTTPCFDPRKTQILGFKFAIGSKSKHTFDGQFTITNINIDPPLKLLPPPTLPPEPPAPIFNQEDNIEVRSDGFYLNNKRWFMVGGNWRVIEYGQNFGATNWFPLGNGISKHENFVKVNLDYIRRAGVKVVRVGLLEDGRTLFDENGNLADNNDYYVVFLKDVRKFLELAKAANIKVEFALFDFLIAGKVEYFGDDPVAVRGRREIITDEDVKEKFLEDFLKPFLEEFGDDPSIIGFDIINEPEWIVSKDDGGGWEDVGDSPEKADVPVPGEKMRSFITDTISTIRTYAPNKFVTVGLSAKFLDIVKDLDLDYFAVHYYPWMGEMENYLDMLNALGKPWSLEEFPTRCDSLLKNEKCENLDSISNYMSQILDGGGSGAMLWNLTPEIDDKTFKHLNRNAVFQELRDWVDNNQQAIY